MKNILKSLFILSLAFSLNSSLISIGFDSSTIYNVGLSYDTSSDDTEKIECPICREEVDSLVELPCRHAVCSVCKRQISRCPFCQAELDVGADKLINREELRQGRLNRRNKALALVRKRMSDLRIERERLEVEFERLERQEDELVSSIKALMPRYEPAKLSGFLIDRVSRFSDLGRFIPDDTEEQCNKLVISYRSIVHGNTYSFELKFNTYLISHYEVINVMGKELLICFLLDAARDNYAIVFFNPETGKRSYMTEYRYNEENRYTYDYRYTEGYFLKRNIENHRIMRFSVEDDKIHIDFINDVGERTSREFMSFRSVSWLRR